MTPPHPVVFPRGRIVFALVPAVLLVLGCDSPHSLGAALDAGGGGTTGAAGSTSGTAGRGGAGGAVTGLGGAAGAGGGAAGAGGGAAGVGGGAAGVGGRPACSDAVPCAQNLFCKRDPSNACGAAILAGHCVEPEPCPANVAPVCGCDGRTYSNNCIRMSAGVGPDPSNACFGSGGNGGRGGGGGGGTAGGGGGGSGGSAGSTGATSCADCNPATQYCGNITGGGFGTAIRFTGCSPLPAACGATPTCACLATVSCSTICSTMSGVLAVVCQAP